MFFPNLPVAVCGSYFSPSFFSGSKIGFIGSNPTAEFQELHLDRRGSRGRCSGHRGAKLHGGVGAGQVRGTDQGEVSSGRFASRLFLFGAKHGKASKTKNAMLGQET